MRRNSTTADRAGGLAGQFRDGAADVGPAAAAPGDPMAMMPISR